MQIKLTIVLVAAACVLAAFPVFAADMPPDGTKNFSAPSDAPSYFANEATPESARVANPVPFTREDVAAAPEDEPAYPSGSETVRHGKHASARKSTKHASGKSKGHGGSWHYAKARSSYATRTAALHGNARHLNAGGGSANVATAPPSAGKTGTMKHAKTGSRQHASASPPDGPAGASAG